MLYTIAMIVAAVTPAPRAEPTPAPSAPAAAMSTDDAAKAAAKRYCVADTFTVSRLKRTVCLTRSEWLGRGFDPLSPRS